MKEKERDEARKLRKEGLSILTIAKQLNVSKSSVSHWVKDIVLSEEQLLRLTETKKTLPSQLLGSKGVKEKTPQIAPRIPRAGPQTSARTPS